MAEVWCNCSQQQHSSSVHVLSRVALVEPTPTHLNSTQLAGVGGTTAGAEVSHTRHSATTPLPHTVPVADLLLLVLVSFGG